LFPDLPKYLSDKAPAKRKHPNQRRAEVDEQSDNILQDFMKDDSIPDYNPFNTV
jgi:hypothetical protein